MERADQVARRSFGALGSWGRGLGVEAAGRPEHSPGTGDPSGARLVALQPRGAPLQLQDPEPAMFLL